MNALKFDIADIESQKLTGDRELAQLATKLRKMSPAVQREHAHKLLHMLGLAHWDDADGIRF